MDINDIEQITVIFKNGQAVAYEKRGLEKLRRLMKASPPLHKEGKRIVIDSYDSGSDSDIPSKKKEKQPKILSPYKVGGFSYQEGANPKDMMADATASGLQFGS